MFELKFIRSLVYNISCQASEVAENLYFRMKSSFAIICFKTNTIYYLILDLISDTCIKKWYFTIRSPPKSLNMFINCVFLSENRKRQFSLITRGASRGNRAELLYLRYCLARICISLSRATTLNFETRMHSSRMHTNRGSVHLLGIPPLGIHTLYTTQASSILHPLYTIPPLPCGQTNV